MIVTAPRTKADILAALAILGGPGLNFWIEIEAARFAQPFGDAWSPADNVRHLIKSTTPIARALRLLPKFALRMAFGAARSSSTYEEVVERYLAALAAGHDAGRLAPSAMTPPPDVEKWQCDLVFECRSAIASLRSALQPLSDADFDHYRMPHPALGQITIREMLFFTLYHYEHHRAGVTRRLAAVGAEQGPPLRQRT